MKVGSENCNGKRFQMCLDISGTDTFEFFQIKKKQQDKSPFKL